MNPIYLKIIPAVECSFNVRRDVVPYFHNLWHFHPEAELTLIIKSTGTRFVGDHIDNFRAGELTLMGPNLPHLWKNDHRYYQADPQLRAESISVHFRKDFAGAPLLSIPEMRMINALFDKSQQGIKITGRTNAVVTEKMTNLIDLNGMDRIIGLLSILQALSVTTEYELLSSKGFVTTDHSADAERINRVYEYVTNHFTRDIRLEEVATIAHMSATAFCRYFKARTRKTFSKFLNEVRISNACKLLIEEKLSISQICYDCGFNNISNFNLQFKNITRMTPLKYQQKHTKHAGKAD